MNPTPSHTWTLNITKQLLGWKSKAFEPVRNGQIYEYRQNPARHNPVRDKGTRLPRLRCLENLLHSCQHKKVMHAAIDLKRTGFFECISDIVLSSPNPPCHHNLPSSSTFSAVTNCVLIWRDGAALLGSCSPATISPSWIWGRDKRNGGVKCDYRGWN